MKFFDKSYINAELDDDEYYKRRDNYFKELDKVKVNASKELYNFIVSENLHDGKIKDMKEIDGKIILQINYGDNQTGKKKSIITYKNARLSSNVELINFEILHYEYSYDEVFHCNFIDTTAREIKIDFDDLTASISKEN